MSFHDPNKAVELGWEEEDKKSGRRKKSQQLLKRASKPGTFEAMGLSASLQRAIKRKGFRLPTPIQRKAIPLIMQGLDMVGMARTGSGKTAAFVIPLICKLTAQQADRVAARGLLLSPTRELALQTHKTLRELSKFDPLRTAVLVGGDAMEAQFAELALNPDVIVATPGRLLHHLSEISGFSLKCVEYVVFDEADRLFEMGLLEQIKEILGHLSAKCQKLMFTATLPERLAEFASAGLSSPQLVKLDLESRLSPDLHLGFYTVRQEEKLAALVHLVASAVERNQLTLVFTSTRHHVEFLAMLLAKRGIDAAQVHGAMDQTARKIHVAKFRARKVMLLITTDVAARGIDIPLIDTVINYDFPPKPPLFVHRVGRAARAGRSGAAFSLLTRDEVPYLLDLYLYLSRPINPAPITSDATASTSSRDANVYGSFPTSLTELLNESIRQDIDDTTELYTQQRSMNNAWGLYCRTRPPASPESVRRAKALASEGVHPELLASLPSARYVSASTIASLAAFTTRLKEFRPAATVLEAEVAGCRGTGAGGLPASGAASSLSSDIMARKRQAHTDIIERERKKKTLGPSLLGVGPSGRNPDAGPQAGDGSLGGSRFRDPRLYISRVKDGTNSDPAFNVVAHDVELKAAVMDLTADDQEGMQAGRRRVHWDKRKRRYVTLQADEKVVAGKRQRAESGKFIKGAKGVKPGSLYAKWSSATKRRVGSGDGSGPSAPVQNDLSKRFTKTGRHMSWKTKPAGREGGKGGRQPVGSELKSKEQVRKQRTLAERRKERQQQHAKGKKGKVMKGRGGRDKE